MARPGMACQPNHAAAMPNTTVHTLSGSRWSRGTSIPAIAAPMTACSASASYSVTCLRSWEKTRRLAE